MYVKYSGVYFITPGNLVTAVKACIHAHASFYGNGLECTVGT